MFYVGLLIGSILIDVALCTDVHSSQGDLQLRNSTSTPLTLENRLRLLEETLSASNVIEGASVDHRLLHLEKTLLAATSRVNQLESKLRRTATLASVRNSVWDYQHEEGATQPNGVSFIRWGRTLCNDSNENATTVYSGYMAGGAYNLDGGGSNFLCLHEHPQWDYRKEGFQKYGGAIYGTESENYDPNENHNDPFSTRNNGGRSVLNSPVPCAACFVPQRSTWMMIPARRECPDGWTLEYKGYVHSQPSGAGYQKTTYECIDEAPEVAVGPINQNQALIHAVQVRCGSLPCSVFVDGWELTCVVCTR